MTAIKNNNTIIIRNTERQSEDVLFNKIVIAFENNRNILIKNKIMGPSENVVMSILQVLCKYKIVQKNLFKWTELNSVRFYIIRKISTCQ